MINRGSAIQLQSDTWVHTRGEQVMALCQVRIRGATALPTTLHLVGDANWVPVGQSWEDFRMLAGEGTTSSGRPVYTVERSTDGALDSLVLRVLLLPRTESSTNSLPIPFIAFQEATSQQRTLSLSHMESPLWKTSGTETWQPLLASQSSILWDKARLSDQPTIYRVPTGSLLAFLTKTTANAAPTVDETTEVSLQSPDIKVKYSARWSQPLVGKSAVRLHVPSSMRVEGAFVDALPARHSLHRLPGDAASGNPTSELVVFVDNGLGGLHSITLQLSTPVRLGKPWRLPRPLLQDARVESSVVQLYRGAELTSDLKILDKADIRFEKVEVRPSPLLLNLHSVIGQAQLLDRFRESVELPIEIKVARTAAVRRAQALMRLSRSDQGWRAQLDATVEVPKGETNHLFLDLPRSLEASLREPIDSNVPMMLWPSADTNRTILCVLPTASESDRAQISLAFRLPASGASQTITIPDIRLLNTSTQRPALALPDSVAGQSVRWSQVGRQLPASWLQSQELGHLQVEGYSLYEAGSSQLQAQWQASDSSGQQPCVLFTEIAFDSPQTHRSIESGSPLHATICYWVEPRGDAYLELEMPDRCELVGVHCSDRPISWTQSSDKSLRVLLQPSYLPIPIELYVKWTRPIEHASHLKTLPLPKLAATISGPMVAGMPSITNDSSNNISLESTSAKLSTAAHAELVGQAWARMLIASAATAADREKDELRSWMQNWHYSKIGLKANVSIAVPVSFFNGRIVPDSIASALAAASSAGTTSGSPTSSTTAQGTSNQAASSSLGGVGGGGATSAQTGGDEIRTTVDDFWRVIYPYEAIVERFPDRVNQERVNQDRANPDRISAARVSGMRANYEWWRFVPGQDGHIDSLTFRTITENNLDVQRYSWAAILLLASGLTWVLASRLLSVRLLEWADRVWPVWIALAGAAAILLPIIWPALVIALGSVILIARRFRESRRDRQFIFQPKAAR